MFPVCKSPSRHHDLCEDPDFGTSDYQSNLKAAQRLTGELLWVTQKSRPDIAFVVQWMASQAVRRPAHVAQVAHRVFRFLHHTRDACLELKPSAEGGLEVFTDASFAPTGVRAGS